jgi:hypothetical protein
MSTRPASTKRESKRRGLLVTVMTALLLGPAVARADIKITPSLPDLSPLVNAITRAEPSSLTVLVTNTGSQIVREVDIVMPSQYNTVTGSSGPDA